MKKEEEKKKDWIEKGLGKEKEKEKEIMMKVNEGFEKGLENWDLKLG
jgi:hypothetical protein